MPAKICNKQCPKYFVLTVDIMHVILSQTVWKFSLAQYFSQCCKKKARSEHKNNAFNLILHIRFHFWTKVTYAIRQNHSFLLAFDNLLRPPSKRMNNFEELVNNCGWSIRFIHTQNQFLYRSFTIGLRHLWFLFCRHCWTPKTYNERIRSIIERTIIADLLSIHDHERTSLEPVFHGHLLCCPAKTLFIWIFPLALFFRFGLR